MTESKGRPDHFSPAACNEIATEAQEGASPAPIFVLECACEQTRPGARVKLKDGGWKMKGKAWIMVVVLATLSACSAPGSKLVGKWVGPMGSRAFEFKSDGTMTELSQAMSLTIKGSGKWEATEDTLTWTETTVEVVGAEGVSTSALEETFKKPHKWLYTMPDKNAMKLNGADGTLLLTRVPND